MCKSDFCQDLKRLRILVYQYPITSYQVYSNTHNSFHNTLNLKNIYYFIPLNIFYLWRIFHSENLRDVNLLKLHCGFKVIKIFSQTIKNEECLILRITYLSIDLLYVYENNDI